MENVLAIRDLKKEYRDVAAVCGISFTVGKGEIVGLLGPNGAGKTTTINMILQVLEPTSGSIHIDGINAREHRSAALSHTNFAAVYAQMPGNLTVRQNLHIFGLLYTVPNLTKRIEELLREFELEKFADTKT